MKILTVYEASTDRTLHRILTDENAVLLAPLLLTGGPAVKSIRSPDEFFADMVGRHWSLFETVPFFDPFFEALYK
jgi:hypothetical protein